MAKQPTPEIPPYDISQPQPAPVENSFVTTDLPDVEKARRNTANKRLLGLFIILSLVVVAFIVWEIIDLMAGYGL